MAFTGARAIPLASSALLTPLLASSNLQPPMTSVQLEHPDGSVDVVSCNHEFSDGTPFYVCPQGGIGMFPTTLPCGCRFPQSGVGVQGVTPHFDIQGPHASAVQNAMMSGLAYHAPGHTIESGIMPSAGMDLSMHPQFEGRYPLP